MTRYVALATDAHPHYAVYAPMVTRMWRRLGYEPLLVLHQDGWNTPFGRFVLGELAEQKLLQLEVPTVEPVEDANTMRVSRLVAAAWPGIEGDDWILTADIDMAPLSRSWFERDEDVVVLRADMYGPIERLLPQTFRFPLCYIGAPASVWRSLLPLQAGKPLDSLRCILNGPTDWHRADGADAPPGHEYDEGLTSYQLLRSPLARGELRRVDEARYQQGRLWLVPMTNEHGWPRRMLIGGDARPETGKHDDAIDFHMPRPAAPWIAEALSLYWPEEADVFRAYWRRAADLTSLRT